MIAQEIGNLSRQQVWEIIDRDQLPVKKLAQTDKARQALIEFYSQQLVESPNFRLRAADLQRAIRIARISCAPNFLLVAHDNVISIRSYMGGLGVQYEFKSEVTGSSKIVLAKSLASTVDKFDKEETIEGSIKHDLYPILCLDRKDGHYSFPGTDPNEYPILPEPKAELEVKLSYHHLKQIIAELAFSIAGSDSPIFDGIHFDVQEQTTICTSTDMLRLTQSAFPSVSTQSGDFILSSEMIRAISSLGFLSISDPSMVTLTVSGTLLEVKFADLPLKLVSRIVAEPYPNLSNHLNTIKSMPTTDVVISQSIRDQLELLIPFCDAKNQHIDLHFHQNSLAGRVRSDRLGSGEFEMEIDGKPDLDLKITVNPKFLLQALSSLGRIDVTFKLAGGRLPIQILRHLANDPYFHCMAVIDLR